jgi:hypothetical protein
VERPANQNLYAAGARTIIGVSIDLERLFNR